MESCSCRESAAVRDRPRTAIVGLGNPLYGDDGVGVIVAQSVFEIVHQKADIDLIDCPAPGARLAERLIGYQQAVVNRRPSQCASQGWDSHPRGHFATLERSPYEPAQRWFS